MENSNQIQENNKPIIDNDDVEEEMVFEKKKKRTPKMIEEIWANMKHTPENYKLIMVLIGTAIVLSIVLLSLSTFIVVKTSSSMSKLVLGFCLFALIAFVFGIFALYKYDKKVEEFLQNQENVDPEDIDQSLERTFLNIFMFSIMLILIIFVLISFLSIANQEKIILYVKSLAVNQDKWIEMFGELSYSYVISKIETVSIVIAVKCAVFSILISVICYYIFDVLGFYRALQTAVQFITLLFFLIGFILLYFAIYAYRYSEVTNVEQSVPDWVIALLIVTSLFSIFLASAGFVGTYFERKGILNVFFYSNIAFELIILGLTIAFFIFADKFESMFNDRCFTLMEIVEERYLKDVISCENKYLFSSFSISGMKCPKERISHHWEVNLGKEVKDHQTLYGCLDKACCLTFYSFLKNNIDYVAITGVILFVCSVLMAIGAYIIRDRLKSGEEVGSSKKDTFIGIVIISAIIVVIFIILFATVPKAPSTNPSKYVLLEETSFNKTVIRKSESETNVFNNSTVKAEVLVEEKQKANEEIKEEIAVKENKTLCTGSCLSLKYHYKVFSKNVVVEPNIIEMNNKNITLVDKKGQNNYDMYAYGGSFVEFLSYYPLSTLSNLFLISNTCSLNPADLVINVEGIPYDKSSSMIKNKSKKSKMKIEENQDESFANPENSNSNDMNGINFKEIDMSKLELGRYVPILSGLNINYAFVSSNYVQLSGMVVEDENRVLSNAKISLEPVDFKDSCKTIEFNTNSNGSFLSNPLYMSKSGYRIRYKITVSKDGYNSYNSFIYVGGYGAATGNQDLGRIMLFNPNYVKIISNNNTSSTNSNSTSASTSTSGSTSESYVIDNNTASNQNTTSSNMTDSNTSQNESNSSSSNSIVNNSTDTTNANSNTDTNTNTTYNTDSNTSSNTNGGNSNTNTNTNTNTNSTNNFVNANIDNTNKIVKLNIDIISMVVNSDSNKPEKDVSVKIYKGYKEFPQNIISDQAKAVVNSQGSNSSKSTQSMDFLKVKKSKKSKLRLKSNEKELNQTDEILFETKTDDNGKYHLIVEERGEYTILYTKQGFHSGIISKLLNYF